MLPWSQELERSAYALAGQRLAQLRAQRVACVDSTNSALLRSAQAGDTTPQVLWAAVQTAGRGRMGRQWQSHNPSDSQSASLDKQPRLHHVEHQRAAAQFDFFYRLGTGAARLVWPVAGGGFGCG